MRSSPTAEHRNSDIADRTPGWTRRVRARLLAARLDRDLDAGLPVVAGTVRAAHADRIVARCERRRLARRLRAALDRARRRGRDKQVLADAELIGQIVQRLHAASPVRPRGMARLRLLLADSQGPLYVAGAGNVAAPLRGVIATL